MGFPTSLEKLITLSLKISLPKIIQGTNLKYQIKAIENYEMQPILRICAMKALLTI